MIRVKHTNYTSKHQIMFDIISNIMSINEKLSMGMRIAATTYSSGDIVILLGNYPDTSFCLNISDAKIIRDSMDKLIKEYENHA